MYKEKDRISLPVWMKWGFVLTCFVLIFFIIYSIILYKDIQNSKSEGFQQSKKRVLHETDVDSVENIVRYHGEILYHVINGQTKDGQKLFVFVPQSEKDKDQLIVVNQSKIITEQAIQKQWQDECKQCELIKITPGLVEKTPVWEITYMDQSGRYVFDYMSMDQGDRYEQFRFKSEY